MTVFQGFSAPKSNTLYTPNQFFDVVIPNSSRGTIRLVAYLIRKTLGWVDTEGNPKNSEAYASYKELEQKAGIGHSAIRAAIDEALEKRYIECLSMGAPHSPGQTGHSALYRLRWDHSGEYIKDPFAFDGFFRANGHLTYIPNAFFDYLIPREKLSVIRVVAAIIRYSIGFKEGEGYRRQHISMSLSQLQRKTLMHKETASLGIQEALALGYLKREQEGIFSPDLSIQRAATYSLRWEGERVSNVAVSNLKKPNSKASLRKSVQDGDGGHSENPSRNRDEDTPKIRPGDLIGTLQNSVQESDQNSVQEASENPSRKPPEIRPGGRSENPSTIEITNLNNTPKQQQPSELDVVEGDSLRSGVLRDLTDPSSAGFTRAAAIRLMETYPVERIRRVLDTLSTEGARSKPAVITAAVKDGTYRLEARPAVVPAESRFAEGFYQGRAGTVEGDATVARASKADLAAAAPVVRRLLGKRAPGEPAAWGESFGKYVRSKSDGPKKIVTLTLAVKAYGDDWLRSVDAEIEKGRRERQERARQSHEEAQKAMYEAYLAAEAHRMESSGEEAYEAFLDEIALKVSRTERSNVYSERAKKELLADLTSEAGRRARFQEFFLSRKMVMSFWEWDQKINPQRFMEESV